MATQSDVRTVPPLGGSAARRCPVRVQWDVVLPAEPTVAVPVDVQQRRDEGNRFEDDVVAELRSVARPSWVFIDAGLGASAKEEETLRAMRSGAPVVVGGRLPLDEAGRRVGEPDLLVRSTDTDQGRAGYVTVDIKHHLTVTVIDDRGSETGREGVGDDEPAPEMSVSSLADPSPEAASLVTQRVLRPHRGDALQLAHYRRMLEAVGHAADGDWGGIIGKQRIVVWYRLDAEMWRTRSTGPHAARQRSTMEIYDFEFDFRLDIAAEAQRVVDGVAGAELLVEPMQCWECATCPWVGHCGPLLTAGPGDVSLVPGVRYAGWRSYREAGIRTRDQLAGVSHRVATLHAAGIDVPTLAGQAAAVPPDTPAVTLVDGGATAQQAALARARLGTAGEIAGLAIDPAIVDLPRSAPVDIVNARAALGKLAVYRWPWVDTVQTPRADLEIDIDMENDITGRVYLWGALVTDRSGSGLVDPGYHPFAGWTVLDESTERNVFDAFWGWLSQIRQAAKLAGVTVRVYCWHEGAEKGEMLRITRSDEAANAAIVEFTSSDEWVDLYQVFKTQWTSGGSVGLKAVAPLAGFAWDADDAGGSISMTYRAVATDAQASADDRATARSWLLAYNRNDVEATLRIRDWLCEPEQADAPSVDLW